MFESVLDTALLVLFFFAGALVGAGAIVTYLRVDDTDTDRARRRAVRKVVTGR